MKFKLLTAQANVLSYVQDDDGEFHKGNDVLTIWRSPPYQLGIAGHGIYEVALRWQQLGVEHKVDIEGVGQLDISVIHDWDDVGPVFITKMRSAGIIVACEIMRALADIDDKEEAVAAVHAIADRYGGTTLFSTVVGEGTPPRRDYPICNIDRHYRRKREASSQ